MTTAVAPSFQDCVDLIVAEVQATRPDLIFADGDVTEAFAHAGAAMFDSAIGYMARSLRALYFGTATGSDLDDIIMDRLGLPREPGTYAFGALVFNRPSGSAGTVLSGFEFSLPMAADGSTQSYTTYVDISFPSGAIAAASVLATASTAGSPGNRTGDTTALTATGTLFDTSIVVTNPGGMAGGNESESDEDYRARAVKYWQTQLRATLMAIEAGALTVAGVTVARATENIDTGLCTLYVSDSDGNSTAQMVHLVEVALEAWRAAGVYIAVTGGMRAALDLTVSVDAYSPGFSAEAATQQIKDSITTRCNLLRVGQDFTIDSIKTAMIAPFSQDITKVSIVSVVVNSVTRSPAVDVAAGTYLIRINTITVQDGGA